MNSITVNGEKYFSYAAACKAHGISLSTFRYRISNGWSNKEALGIEQHAKIKVNGKLYSTITEACKFYGVSLDTFRYRHAKGWTIKEALGIKLRNKSDKCTGHVYLITNIKNDKIYVGITTQKCKFRFAQHLSLARSGSTTKLHQAMIAYGAENFSIQRIAKTRSRKELAALEKQYIEHYDSVEMGYNTKSSSGSPVGGGGVPIKYKDKVFSSQAALARHLGVSKPTIKNRLAKNRPLTENLRSRGLSVTVNGVEFTSIAAASRHFGISPTAMRYRLTEKYIDKYENTVNTEDMTMRDTRKPKTKALKRKKR